jgi:hypothetical protein
MSISSELHTYIAQLHRRLRLGAWMRGAAIFAATALGVTLALVLVLNYFAFPAHGVTVARLLIAVCLAIAAILGAAAPLARMTRARAVSEAESANPDLEQRLTTFEERARQGGDPFIELLAADTLQRTHETAPSLLVPDNRLFALGGTALGCFVVLLWMIADGPGFLGYGASLIWTGPKKNAAPLYSIVVSPGNATVRRNSDQLVLAHVTGMRPEKAQLFARYQSAAGWEPVTMQAAPDSGGGANYQFVVAGLPENIEYYVAAGPLVSQHYKMHVVDLPSVKEIRVTYHFPEWTAMKAVTEEHSGDLRAIEGTDAQIELQMDRPLHNGQLTLDDGKTIRLSGGEGNKYQATIHMEKDGAYHVAATDDGVPVRLSEDYFIATDKAMPPDISIDRPTGDYRASPIEEVTVGVKAADQFGLRGVHVHYSVNGGPDHDISLLKVPGAKNADGTTMLSLEDFKLVPGDVISVYANARDGHTEARTDISFIQVDPFEREFSQSQQSGGGGGGGAGGNNQTEISKREKELIAATWKQQNDQTATPKDSATQGQFLSDAQRKLHDQVMALSVRMQSRDISGANEEFNDFDKDMQAAAAAMAPSAEKLQSMQWKDALGLEQKALQSLLRAEATFRKIEVAFGQRGGGGGGGGNSGRDLASLFDLELDTEKNQYETAQSASPAEQHEKDVEDALEKLDALAKRQQDLANQQHDPQQSFEQRWQQEMLRREAEQLQRQMEQLARNGQQGQQQSGQSESGQDAQSQSSASQSGAAGTTASQSSRQQANGQSPSSSTNPSGTGKAGAGKPAQSTDQRIEEALNRVQQATDIMKRDSAKQPDSAAAREAADRLRDAANLLAGTQQQIATNKVESLANDASRIAQQAREQAQRINRLAGQAEHSDAAADSSSNAKSGEPGALNLDSMMARLKERDQLASERQQLSNDLSRLQTNMRNAAREMAPNQPEAAQKLRDALTEMDESDLDNHVQRTADWLRSGIDPNSNGTEGQIAQGLAKLNEQLHQAEKAMGRGKPGQAGASQGDQSAALDQVERLRTLLNGFGQQNNDRAGGQQRNGQAPNNPGNQSGNQGQYHGGLGRNGQQPGSNNQSNGQNLAQGQLSRSGQRGANGTAGGANQNGAQNGDGSGDTRNGGGINGTVWGNFDTGGNTPHARGQQQAAPGDASGNPADTERTFDQSMRQLRQLRQSIHDDPQAAKELADLERQMQRLDLNRFPGNPAMVQHMHQEILSSVDKLELQLERDGASAEARTGKPDAIPAGYQDSVAEYYRRLSKNP